MNLSLYHIVENLNTEVAVPATGMSVRTLYRDDIVKAVLFGFAGHELANTEPRGLLSCIS
jgi:hypothetical protein